jgi:hypothetical protein
MANHECNSLRIVTGFINPIAPNSRQAAKSCPAGLTKSPDWHWRGIPRKTCGEIMCNEGAFLGAFPRQMFALKMKDVRYADSLFAT